MGHPSEIDEIFDDISYNKGASVIRMLHRYIGDDDFRKGMNIYLTRHQVGKFKKVQLLLVIKFHTKYVVFFSIKIHLLKIYGLRWKKLLINQLEL